MYLLTSVLFVYLFCLFQYNYFKILTKTLFILSFSFLLVDKNIIYQLITLLPLSEVVMLKIDGYIGGDGFLESNLQKGNLNNYLKYFLNNLWYYFSLIYIIINLKRKDDLFYLYISLVILSNFSLMYQMYLQE